MRLDDAFFVVQAQGFDSQAGDLRKLADGEHVLPRMFDYRVCPRGRVKRRVADFGQKSANYLKRTITLKKYRRNIINAAA